MKRLRDDAYVNPQFKRPFGPSSRGESNGMPGPHFSNGGVGNNSGVGGGTATGLVPSGTQKLTTNDALTYLKEVKDMFQDQREKYDCFLDVMKDFKAQRIDTAGVIGTVKELFKGHPNLILGFNTFLPKGYEITLDEEEETQPRRTVEFDEAISFVNKIKKRFEDDDRVYKSFLDILNMYRKEHKGITEVYQEVAALFNEHQDLLDEFTKFLPDTSDMELNPAPHASFSRHSLHRYDEKCAAASTMRQSHIDKIRHRRDKVFGPREERDISVEPPERDDDKTVVKLNKDQKKQIDKENRDIRSRNQDAQDHDGDNNGDASTHRPSDKRKSARKLDGLGCQSGLNAYEDKDISKSVYGPEFSFCEKVKERLQSADDYQAFLKCLNIYSREIITRRELQGLVYDLLGKYPDLMDGFNEFLEHSERIDGFLAGVMGRKAIQNEENSSKLLRIDEKDKEKKRELEFGKEKERCNLKYWGKSIQELDLSNCQRCSPSYRLLPDDYPIHTASQISELGNDVLNDRWVSVTSGSEDYSFKHMRRNQYEESLFRCEDDRFELDMLLESVSSTAERAQELLNGINNKSLGTEGTICIEDHLSALNLRCIERLYGDHGLDVMDILRKNPSLSLPVIVSRLKKKQEEWTKCRSDFNKVWAEIYSKNHYKSLDHRSFYFKQQDSKNLSTKSLVAEIKEIKENRKKEDDLLLSISARSRYSIIPDLEFDYGDTQIHEDIYKIIRYSCEEVCSTKEQVNKILRLWTSFLEPMLGIHSHQRRIEASEDNHAFKRQIADSSMIITMGSRESPTSDARVLSSKQSKCVTNGQAIINSVNCAHILAKEGHILSSIEKLSSFDTPAASRLYANHGQCTDSVGLNNDQIEESSGIRKHLTEDILHAEQEALQSCLSANGELLEGSKISECNRDSFDPPKNEKEEGELSPDGDFEEIFCGDQDRNLEVLHTKDCAPNELKFKAGFHEARATVGSDENEADADDEGSENVSEAGEDASGSDSAADECSRDGHYMQEDGDQADLDSKPESDVEMQNTSEAHEIGADGASFPSSESFLQTCKPLSKHVGSSSLGSEKMNRWVFYGNDSFYVLFRLHQVLYERILSAKVNSASGESKWRTLADSASDGYTRLLIGYTRFMSALYHLLDGSSDGTKYEDDCRLLIGNQSYVLFTLDKLIYRLVKQLQTISNEEVETKLLQLYEYESQSNPDKPVDSVYHDNVHVLLHDENIYRLECKSSPTRLYIQLMDDRNEKSEAIAVSLDPIFASYLQSHYLSVNGKNGSMKLMLKRLLRKYNNNTDESSAFFMAMEKLKIFNGLECKMAAASFKISYVLDTEDYFSRVGRKRGNRSIEKCMSSNQSRVQRFHRFLDSSLK